MVSRKRPLFVILAALLIGYVLSVGLLERAIIHNSRYLQLRPLYGPVDWVGQRSFMVGSYHRYLAMWTGESLLELEFRRTMQSIDLRSIPDIPEVRIGFPTEEEWEEIVRRRSE